MKFSLFIYLLCFYFRCFLTFTLWLSREWTSFFVRAQLHLWLPGRLLLAFVPVQHDRYVKIIFSFFGFCKHCLGKLFSILNNVFRLLQNIYDHQHWMTDMQNTKQIKTRARPKNFRMLYLFDTNLYLCVLTEFSFIWWAASAVNIIWVMEMLIDVSAKYVILWKTRNKFVNSV